MGNAEPAALAQALLDPQRTDPQLIERVATWLREALREARARWPEVRLDDGDFVDHLARCLPAAGDPEAELVSLRSEDLFLACACGRGDPRALAIFTELARPVLTRIFEAPSAQGVDREDLQQQLMERLMVGSETVPPKILDYTGRGKLTAWVRVAATRLRIDSERRRSDKSDPIDDTALARIEHAMSADMELSYLEQRYRAIFKEVFAAVVRGLEPEQRNLLRLTVIEGLSTTQIARVHGVHRATAKRWMVQVRTRLLQDTEQALSERLGVATHEVHSVLKLIRTGLEASMRRHLAEDT